MELTIIDAHDWKKSIEISKAVIRIGRLPANDIQLSSQQIAPVHLQLHRSEGNPSVCKVLNVGGEVEVWQNHTQLFLNPYEIIPINNDDEIVLGEFRVQFKLPLTARMVTDSSLIKASLSFPDATLNPDKVTSGYLSLTNAGPKTACQFEVMADGFPADCVQIEPVPLLFPGAQEDVRVSLFHKKLYPSAGVQELSIEVSSPSSYPGEQVIIRQDIYVTPVLDHSVEIIDDNVHEGVSEKSVGNKTGTQNLPTANQPAVQPQIVSAEKVEQHSPNSEQGISELTRETLSEPLVKLDPEPVLPGLASSSAPLHQVDLETENKEEKIPIASLAKPEPKVVQSPSEDFWDEE